MEIKTVRGMHLWQQVKQNLVLINVLRFFGIILIHHLIYVKEDLSVTAFF